MNINRKPRQGMSGGRVVVIALTLLSILIFAQLISAAQGNEPPAPTAEAPSDINAPSDAELLAMPPTIDRYLAAHTLPNGTFTAADLSDSTKTVSDSTVSPGGVFEYTITVVNNGGVAIPVEVTDVLPEEVVYISHQCPPLITNSCGFSTGTVTWEGTSTAGESAAITITVMLKTDAVPGSIVTNTAQIDSPEQELEVSVDVTVFELVTSPFQFLPLLINVPQPAPVTLAAGLPNGGNSWDLSWTTSENATGYEIEESNDPGFVTVTSTVLGKVSTHKITKSPSPDNVFYYRARTLIGNLVGPWSNVVSVVGGYRDDFDDPSTGWALRRRTSYKTNNDVIVAHGFYENGRYVTMVKSRWDWLIASPLQPAPRVPYAIDFEARIISQGYVHSAGVVFGGDWGGAACPPTDNEAWVNHANCFNHFYNTNSIYNDTDSSNVRIGLLFERVDQLEWRPNDGGSPLKRVGDIPLSVKDYKNIDAKGWNHYRIEVREGSILVYAAKVGEPLKLQYEYTDTRWIGSPYFGFFTSTDIIENSTWRFEYIEVMPLDQ